MHHDQTFQKIVGVAYMRYLNTDTQMRPAQRALKDASTLTGCNTDWGYRLHPIHNTDSPWETSDWCPKSFCLSPLIAEESPLIAEELDERKVKETRCSRVHQSTRTTLVPTPSTICSSTYCECDNGIGQKQRTSICYSSNLWQTQHILKQNEIEISICWTCTGRLSRTA